MPTGGVAAPGVRLVDWETLLRESDVISLHAPLTAETQRLIRAESIATMKDGVILINTARGGLVDEADLAAALASGKVGAAGLDVFVNEPPIGSPLLGAPNVLFSPHVASLDHEGLRQMANMAAQTVADLYQGRWPAERIVNGQSLGPNWSWRANQSASSAARG
jgi:phosphoglycerate dehydrogenase-like enzyme